MLLKKLWDFSRPHTIVGSTVSIAALFAISLAWQYKQVTWQHWHEHKLLWWLTLVSALGCNVYITGLNQIADIEIDRINKPWLPIPSGMMRMRQAIYTVVAAGIIAIVAGFAGSWVLGVLILVIMAIGTAYSLPPFRLKQHHILAALCILLVRGVLVNMFMPVHFIYVFSAQLHMPASVWPITFFIVGFSLAIAWFKDIPDTAGDRVFKIKTLALDITPKRAFHFGVGAVALSFVGMLLLAIVLKLQVQPILFYTGNALLLLLFLYGASRVNMEVPANIKTYYLRFWGFFFAGYLLYALAFIMH